MCSRQCLADAQTHMTAAMQSGRKDWKAKLAHLVDKAVVPNGRVLHTRFHVMTEFLHTFLPVANDSRYDIRCAVCV